MDCDCASAPNYAPVAAASERAAELGHELGMAQLTEARRQYDENMGVARPIVDAQTRIMDETARQGADYYDYMVANQRPVEAALNAEAMAAGTEGQQQAAADRAIADAQGGYTRALNQGFRQSRRYGLQPQNQAGSQMLQQAQSQAAAAYGAREKEKNLGYAKKMDVAGLYRGLSGASTGAYATALNSGNSANQNQMAPGNALLGGMAQGAQMQQTGTGQQLQGLGSILGSQTSMYNADQGGDNGFMGMLGTLGGAAIKAYPWSDRRLKQDIVLTGKDETTGLNLYEFNYIGDPEHRYRGVMADEVEEYMPDAVSYSADGFAAVNYSMLGIEMVEV
jgi:hypothetical protein